MGHEELGDSPEESILGSVLLGFGASFFSFAFVCVSASLLACPAPELPRAQAVA